MPWFKQTFQQHLSKLWNSFPFRPTCPESPRPTVFLFSFPSYVEVISITLKGHSAGQNGTTGMRREDKNVSYNQMSHKTCLCPIKKFLSKKEPHVWVRHNKIKNFRKRRHVFWDTLYMSSYLWLIQWAASYTEAAMTFIKMRVASDIKTCLLSATRKQMSFDWSFFLFALREDKMSTEVSSTTLEIMM